MRYDVVHIADLRFPGGTSSAVAHEIRSLAAAGYRVAVVAKRAATLKQQRPVNPSIQAVFDAGLATLVTDAAIEARLAVLHNPYILESMEEGLPKINVEQAVMVAHQPLTDGNGVPYFNWREVDARAQAWMGRTVVWAPISPVSRANLVASSVGLPVLDEDWTNVVFVADWAQNPERPRNARPALGRHSRPDWAKWPATAEELFTIYPDDPGYDVRFLGVGDGLKALLRGADKPANWSTWAFNEMNVKDFLSDLDVFAYYHHPDWVEGFGRTIAEAMAAGIPVILPETFRATFQEAALYRAPADVRATVDELWADPETARLQGRLAQRWIEKHYGPARYLARIERLIGKPLAHDPAIPASADAATPAGEGAEGFVWAAVERFTPAATAPVEAARRFDVVHLGDFRTIRETPLRVAHSVRIEHAAGYATGLAHLASNDPKGLGHIHPELDQVVREGLAAPVDPEAGEIATNLLVVHQPDLVFDRFDALDLSGMPRVHARKVVVVHDRGMPPELLLRRNALFRAIWGEVVWMPTTETRRAELDDKPDVSVGDAWVAAVRCKPWRDRPHDRREALIIGRIARNAESDWPKSVEDVERAHPHGDGVCMRAFGWPRLTKLPSPAARSWETIQMGEIGLERFLGNLDAVVHVASGDAADSPVHALLSAMAQGIPVVGSRELARDVGKMVKIVSPRGAQDFVAAFHADRTVGRALGLEQARAVRHAHGDGVHRARLAKLAGQPSGAAPMVNHGARKRTLFLSSNGVGLGHLTRLLSIARRLPDDHEPCFVTMSQGLPIVRQCGYPVEYLPFHAFAGCDPTNWNPWFADQVGQVIDFHRADTVVLDAGSPYQGLLDAMAARPHVNHAWIRRGMWKDDRPRTAIQRQRFFDLIVEPAEIADAEDKGATTENRAFTTRVAPIRFLDDDEILSKEEACRRLGLDPRRPSCLIQLGSGSNRDIVTMIDTVLEKVRAAPGMQPVIAEWLISPNPLDLWPGVKRLRGFPLSLYFNAFDFTVSASGYNSFNEIVSFGLPAVFMANDHALMDDQAGRARYAQDQDAAFHLPDDRPDAIGPLVEQLLDPGIRETMIAGCRRIALGNGAQAAADAVAAL